MGLTFSVFYVRCPACDDPVLPNSISQPGVQDLPLAKCKACGRLIQITKDPETGQQTVELADEN
jgi:uncharacterized Zn finger protein